jgi:predicted metal-dependent phosphoesterase TrpH
MAVTIDLHLHTTASDGRCPPDELVERAHALGLRALSVTDHDTREGTAAARAAAHALGIEFLDGIEITAVHEGRDVHVLAYGLPDEAPALDRLLAEQRQRRVGRAQEIAGRLARLNAPINVDGLRAASAQRTGKAISRPQIAEALVAAGHASSIADAFDRYLDERAPAYVPHTGMSPADVIALVTQYGGVASIAHPGQLKKDYLVEQLADEGLQCIEAYHSSHDERVQQHYLDLAQRLGLAVTGGSDFHGPGTRRAEFFGCVGLPLRWYERLKTLIEDRA